MFVFPFFFCNLTLEMSETNEKIEFILRQTNYTKEEAQKKLDLFQNNPIVVVKDYLGIKHSLPSPLVSINQEIYKQIRSTLKIDPSHHLFYPPSASSSEPSKPME